MLKGSLTHNPMGYDKAFWDQINNKKKLVVTDLKKLFWTFRLKYYNCSGRSSSNILIIIFHGAPNAYLDEGLLKTKPVFLSIQFL